MPGLKPLYRPQFTVDQIEEAQRICNKHSAPHNMVQRAKLVLLLHQHPDIDNPRAARLVGRHENWVRYWRKRWPSRDFRCVINRAVGEHQLYRPTTMR